MPFLPGPDGEMARQHGSSACGLTVQRSHLQGEAQIEVWEQDLAPWELQSAWKLGSTDGRFVHRRTGVPLPRASHQCSCAPIWHRKGCAVPGASESIGSFLRAMPNTVLVPTIALTHRCTQHCPQRNTTTAGSTCRDLLPEGSV